MRVREGKTEKLKLISDECRRGFFQTVERSDLFLDRMCER